MEFLRNARQQKIEHLQAFLEQYPQDERALRHALRTCAPKCANFGRAELEAGERECLSNCVWKLGQVLSSDL